MARDRRRTLLIQHGVATIDSAESIGRHCWINQQVTTATTPPARRRCAIASGLGAGVIVIGPITLHDGATVVDPISKFTGTDTSAMLSNDVTHPNQQGELCMASAVVDSLRGHGFAELT